MSWISDVKEEIRNLDLSKKSLRKFGLLVGSVLLAISAWMIFKNHLPTFRYILGILGFCLITSGFLVPLSLKYIYQIWMGMAFAIGWIISRVLLTIIFTLVVIPIGLLMRIVGKKSLDIDMKNQKESYWIIKSKDRELNYDKMY